jgi:hypothetical protein
MSASHVPCLRVRVAQRPFLRIRAEPYLTFLRGVLILDIVIKLRSHSKYNMVHRIKKLLLCLFPALFMLASCGSTTPQTGDRSAAEVQIRQNAVNNNFNPNSISKEEKEKVRENINIYVSQLNAIIRRKDYNEWLKHLSPAWESYLASRQNLMQASQAQRIRDNGIVLKSLFDYFVNVVYPSRQNLRIDDIEFVDENKVKAYMVNNGQRLRVYELERNGDTWRICG